MQCGAEQQPRILLSPPPNGKAFGAPFVQDDSAVTDDSVVDEGGAGAAVQWLGINERPAAKAGYIAILHSVA